MQPMTRHRARPAIAAAALAAAALVACGGGGNPLGNPDSVANPATPSGQKLSFIYFQKCINPIFLARLQITQNGVTTTNTCASQGCHDNTNGTGGAFRVEGTATTVDLANAANTPEVVRASDMYKNFYSAQGESIIGAPDSSRLLNKPLVRNVLHGGGVVFHDVQDPNVKLIEYWINHPMPQGQDEFSSAGYNLLTPAGPAGDCTPPP
jgi:hypothetical protein